MLKIETFSFSLTLKSVAPYLKSLYEKHKSWFIRCFALTFTILCTFTLYGVGEPRPYHISVPRGFLNSLILNGPLWFSSFRWIRVRLKYLVALFVFLSSFGVFLATPWGWTLAFLSLIFHIAFIFSLIKSKEEL